jgi:hypothetical protein
MKNNMAIGSVVISNQIMVMFTVGTIVPYETIEDALFAQGFNDYVINRQTYSTTTDITVTLNPPTTPLTGITVPFPAATTLSKLATAASHFGGA